VSLKRVTLFNFFGFKVKADASWLVISVLISWTMSSHIFPSLYPGQSLNIYQIMGISTLAGVIFSVIAHEAAHAVIAEYYNMPITSITLMVFGGVAEMKGEPSHPKGEFYMAIAGPIMSFLLGMFFWALANLYVNLIDSGAIYYVLNYLGDLNILIAAFNVIPAFPLDGGRALRAIVWGRKNNLVEATRIASKYGAVLAYSLIAFSCYKIVIEESFISGMWLGILGFFVYNSGDYAVKHIESRSLLADEKVSRFLTTNAVTISPDITVSELINLYVDKHYQRSFPVVDNGELVGIVYLNVVLSMDRSKWDWLHIRTVMEALNPSNVIGVNESAADALELIKKEGKELLLVMDSNNKYLGVIMFLDLANYLTITMRVDHNRPIRKSRTAKE